MKPILKRLDRHIVFIVLLVLVLCTVISRNIVLESLTMLYVLALALVYYLRYYRKKEGVFYIRTPISTTYYIFAGLLILIGMVSFWLSYKHDSMYDVLFPLIFCVHGIWYLLNTPTYLIVNGHTLIHTEDWSMPQYFDLHELKSFQHSTYYLDLMFDKKITLELDKLDPGDQARLLDYLAALGVENKGMR